MIRYLFLIVLSLLFHFSFAQKQTADQSKIITTKKVFLKHGGNQTDSLMIPVVSEQYPELKKALNDSSLFFGDSLDAIVNRYESNGSGITAFNYDVTYIDKNVVSLRLYYETMGSYPDESTESLTLNIRTGKAYQLNNEINPNGLNWIYTSYKELLKKRIAADKRGIEEAKENKKDDSDEKDGYIKADENIDDIYKDLDESADAITMETLLSNYIFTDKGITFTTDDVLPHAIRNFEPQRDWFVPYKKLKPYLLPKAIVIK